MKKRYYIIIVLGVVVLFGLSLLLYLRSGTQPNQGDNVEPIGDLKSDVPTNSSLSIPTASGPVIVSNFLQQHDAVEQGYTVFFQTPTYALGYDGPSRQFLIHTYALNLAEFQKITREAENKLLSLLNINPAEACKLNVTITNFRADDETISYKSFPLSFCT